MIFPRASATQARIAARSGCRSIQWTRPGEVTTSSAQSSRQSGIVASASSTSHGRILGSAKALGAQLLAGLLGLAEPVEAHALEDLRRLRELDVLVGDDLEVVAPRVANPVPADLGSRVPGGLESAVPVIDDQPEVSVVVG